MRTIDLKLTLNTPLHIGHGTEQTPHLFMRDTQGRLSLRAGTVKGIHRAAVRQMAAGLGLVLCQSGCYPLDGQKPCIVCHLFGSAWVEGRLYYRDLMAANPVVETTAIIRTAQHRRRRVQRSITQRELEVLPAATTFSGQINHLISDNAQLGLVLAALRGINAIGSANASGYGLCRVEVYALDNNKNRINEHDLGSALALLRQRKP